MQKRVSAKSCTVVPGEYDRGLAWEYQTANVVDNLKRVAELCEPAGADNGARAAQSLDRSRGGLLDGCPSGVPDLPGGRVPVVQDLGRISTISRSQKGICSRIWTRRGMRSCIFKSETIRVAKSRQPARSNITTFFGISKARAIEVSWGWSNGNSIPGKAGERAVIDAYIACDRN